MQLQNLSLQAIKETDIATYLQSIGHLPQHTRGNDLWYLSPLHEEKTPSFKVNKGLNCWYDHSLGKGGNLVDFLLLYYQCSAKELLQKSRDFLSFPQQKKNVLSILNDDKNIVGSGAKAIEQNSLNSAAKNKEQNNLAIISEQPLTNSFLISYVRSRNIPVDIAHNYLKEVYYVMHDKTYYALGFKNDSGGYELRNKYFKGSSSPKDVTIILSPNKAEDISVFEGFFSFLSYLAVKEKYSLSLTNFLVLNSLSLFDKSLTKMEQYAKVCLYLDNDQPAVKQQQSLSKEVKGLPMREAYIEVVNLHRNPLVSLPQNR